MFPHTGLLQTTASNGSASNTAGSCLSTNSDGRFPSSKKGVPWTGNCDMKPDLLWMPVQLVPDHRRCRLLATDWQAAGGCAAQPNITQFSKDFGQVSEVTRTQNQEATQFFCSRPRGTPALENLVASSPTELRYWRELLVGSATTDAMVDVLTSIQYGAEPKAVLRTAWQKKYWNNVVRAYKMYNIRAETFGLQSPDLWADLACAAPVIDSTVVADRQTRITLVRNTTGLQGEQSLNNNNAYQAQVEEYNSNTWLNSRSSFLDRFSTSASAVFADKVDTDPSGVGVDTGSSAVDDGDKGDQLSVFRPFRYPFGHNPNDGALALYNEDHETACCERRFAHADKKDSPALDRTMAFHVRTPKSVFRLGGWGSLASFIMPPALPENLICNPRATCKAQCSGVVQGEGKCLTMTVGDLKVNGGLGCADHMTSADINPGPIAVDRCHRINAISTEGGNVCRVKFEPYKASLNLALSMSSDMYEECKGGFDDMAGMETWRAVSCFKYCHAYCKPNTEIGACSPGMSADECKESMMGGPPGETYLRCNVNNADASPGWWCDSFASKFCEDRADAKTSKACACFNLPDDTLNVSDIARCGSSSCANPLAYKLLRTKTSACPSCSIVMAQNNCFQVRDNVFGDGVGDVEITNNAKSTMEMNLDGNAGCGHQEAEENFVEAREALFHDLRPFKWRGMSDRSATDSSNKGHGQQPKTRCVIIPPISGSGGCRKVPADNFGAFFEETFSDEVSTDAAGAGAGASSSSSSSSKSWSDCDNRAAFYDSTCKSPLITTESTCFIIPRPGATCTPLGSDFNDKVAYGGFVHTPAGVASVHTEGQCASETVRLQGQCGGGAVDDKWSYEWTSGGKWGAVAVPSDYERKSCKIIPPHGDTGSCEEQLLRIRDAGGSFFDEWADTFTDGAAAAGDTTTCKAKASKWQEKCAVALKSDGSTCFVIPPYGIVECSNNAIYDSHYGPMVKAGGFIEPSAKTEVECAVTATRMGAVCDGSSGKKWTSAWSPPGVWMGIHQPFKASAIVRQASPSTHMFYTKHASEKGRFGVASQRPEAWSELCVENVLPNDIGALEITHAGCKISMMGAEKGCADALNIPAIFDDFATSGVSSYSQLDCDKRAQKHATVCGSTDGTVKGRYRKATAGTCVITPNSTSTCTSMPHLPRSMFDAWYYTDDDVMLGDSDCTKFRDKLRSECGDAWQLTTSDWQTSADAAVLSNGSCTKRGTYHEVDIGDVWDRFRGLLMPLFDPIVSRDMEFFSPEEANNKFARLCAAICENSALGCVGFRWTPHSQHCAFFGSPLQLLPTSSAPTGTGTTAATAADDIRSRPSAAAAAAAAAAATTPAQGSQWLNATTAATVVAMVLVVAGGVAWFSGNGEDGDNETSSDESTGVLPAPGVPPAPAAPTQPSQLLPPPSDVVTVPDTPGVGVPPAPTPPPPDNELLLGPSQPSPLSAVVAAPNPPGESEAPIARTQEQEPLLSSEDGVRGAAGVLSGILTALFRAATQ
jgi:hypothetical protein